MKIATHTAAKRVCLGALATALALGAGSAAAYAETSQQAMDELLAKIAAGPSSEGTYDYADNQVVSGSSLKLKSKTSYPAKFDLRDKGYVTSVKAQQPWGTCWAFGIVAASESSILGELGLTTSQFKEKYGVDLDLSEHHLSWFAKTALPTDTEDDYDGQAGEGLHHQDPTDSSNMEAGYGYFGTTAYSAGMGAVVEQYVYNGKVMEFAPYRGTAGKVTAINKVTGEQKDFANLKAAQDDPLYTPYVYSKDDDWSLPESMRFAQSYTLEESNILPDIVSSYDKETGEYALNTDGINAVKDQLTQNRGVCVSFQADTFLPWQNDNAYTSRNINLDTWSHFSWSEDGNTLDVNHAVCVVGWDDDYKASNFTHNVYKKDAEGNLVKDDDGNYIVDEEATAKTTPQGDGAWIVKNSWGSDTEEFPYSGKKWGDHGYFYISYYDMSLCDAETFDFAVSKEEQKEYDYSLVYQYDYMTSNNTNQVTSYQPASMANVFTADSDCSIKDVSCVTTKPDTTVAYAIVKLDKNAANPDDGKVVMVSKGQTYQYGGYHRYKLKKPICIKKGQKFCVIATQTFEQEVYGNTYSVYSVNFNYDWGYAGELNEDEYSVGIINPGESWLCTFDYGSKTSTWKDWSEVAGILTAFNLDYQGATLDNFNIKAYADPMKANTLKLKAKSKTVSNKKASKFSIKPLKAIGKVSYSVVKKAKKAGIRVSKAGVVTVKKGTKVGNYKVRVKAAGNSTHMPATKAFKVKVRR